VGLGVPAGILAYAIIGALLGAGFGIVQSRIPARSILVKALIYSLAVLLLFQVLWKTLLERLLGFNLETVSVIVPWVIELSDHSADFLDRYAGAFGYKDESSS
jgi:hypothetical protein